jgi:hypothetical protein
MQLAIAKMLSAELMTRISAVFYGMPLKDRHPATFDHLDTE